MRDLVWFMSMMPCAIIAVLLGVVPVPLGITGVLIMVAGSFYFGYCLYSDGMALIEIKIDEESLEIAEGEEGPTVEVQDSAD